MLIALRVWKTSWQAVRVQLLVRSDSVVALTMAATLKAASGPVALIASELALDIGDASFRPSTLEHTPGVTNKVADILSRKFVPDSNFSVPSALAGILQVQVPERRRSWRRTLSVPGQT